MLGDRRRGARGRPPNGELAVRTRIVGLAVWVSVLATALFGVPLGIAVFEYAVQAERNKLLRTADAVAIAVAEDVYDGEQVDAIHQRDAVDISVYAADGAQLGGVGPATVPADVSKALRGKAASGTDGENLVVAVPVTHEDDVIGAVRAAAPRSSVVQEVALLWAAMIALAALAVTTAWLVGRRQARRLARPLEELAVAARRLGDGDFSVRTQRGGIAEIDAVGTALDSTATRLDDLVTRERAFSADASHQLRTPLAGLRLRLEAALEGTDHDRRAAIEASLADADRLETTVEELLDLARDRLNRPIEPVDVAGLLQELAPSWREQLARLHRELDLRLDADLPQTRASTAALRQVLAVLLDNATRHGAGRVTLTARETTDAVAVDVSDEGTGISEPEATLFARRAQGNGHGIGLALARRLIEAEDGRLQLSSRAPAVFTLLLPVEDDAPLPPASTPQPRDEHV